MIFAIFLTVLSAGLAYIGYRVVTEYRAAIGTPWDRLLATAKDSSTILWQYVVIAGGWFLTSAGTIADAVNLPDVRPWLTEHLSPEMAGGLFAVVSLVTIFARLRTL